MRICAYRAIVSNSTRFQVENGEVILVVFSSSINRLFTDLSSSNCHHFVVLLLGKPTRNRVVIEVGK